MITPGDPRHGTLAGYCAGCREACCRRANALKQNLRRLGRVDSNVDGTGTRRRVHALHAQGWTSEHIATAAGLTTPTVKRLLPTTRVGTPVRKSTAAAIVRAYDALAMKRGPSVYNATCAIKKGWPGPLAWDDDPEDAGSPHFIDNPDAVPAGMEVVGEEIDEVLVQRVMNGQRVTASPTERVEIIRRWLAAGRALNVLERAQGWNTRRDLLRQAS